MYTFQPIATVPVDHTGFGLIVTGAILLSLIYIINDDEKLWALVVSAVLGSLVCLLAYCVSYVWTNQTPTTYANTPVTAKFVEFVAEGYAVDERHGKSTYRVDKHEQYVVYSVDGQRVLLRAGLGQNYPETAVLYKN